jgi:two-component system, chemotaxis family, CheB/CheR fusion protein
MVKKKRPLSKARPKKAPPRAAASPQRKQLEQDLPELPTSDWPPFPLVAVGASAGGLEAATQILDTLPAKPGVAIVIVQHLSPKVASLLPELLAGHSKLPVHQVTDEMRIEPDHIYVIPPDRQMALQDGHLRLQARPTDRSQYTPIDYFFSSVAEHAQTRAIGIILSGTASDGANGIRAIKASGGITIVQTPESAKYDGMPRAAINTQLVDLVLEPREIAEELVRIVGHPFVRELPIERGDEPSLDEEQLRRIFLLLSNATGVDFTHYKLPTVRRRLQRRMVLQKITTVDHYIKYLEQNQAEVHHLYQDILIHVTKFFREPESFNALRDYVLP